MAIRDALLQFTGIGASGFSPTATGDNIAPFTYDTAPLGLPTGSGGAATTGYNAGSGVNAGRDLGLGGEMWIEVLVTAAVTSAGAATCRFDFGTDALATLGSFVSSTGVGLLLSSAVYPKATLVLGFAYRAQLPAGLTYLEFIGMNVNIGTAVLTAGTFEAKMLMNIQQADLYLSGFAVS